MPVLALDGQTIAYDCAGSYGPPVIFIHGVGSDRRVWSEQIDYFGRQRLALAVDLRGHGESAVPAGTIDRPAFASDIVAMLDALGIDAAHLVGLSMGGVVALETYRLHPERVLSLVLADTFAAFPGFEEAQARREQDVGSMSMQQIAEERIPACLRPQPDPARLRSAVEQMAAKDKRVYLESSTATWSPDFRSILPGINVPVLVLWGEYDTVTPRHLSEELAEGIPGARLVVLPDAGHISNLDNPSAFNRAVAEFLADVSTGQPEQGAQIG